jgi:RecA-family ATPase
MAEDHLNQSGSPGKDDLDNQFGFCTFHQIHKIADQAQDYIVERLIIPRSIGVMIGEWGIGKSPFAMQLATTLAAGLDTFLGYYKTTGRPLRVLYIDMENGAAAVANVVTRISSFLKLPEVPTTLKVHSPNFSPERPPTLRALSVKDYILRTTKQSRFDFIIIDPLRAFCPEAETGNDEAIKLINGLRDLAKQTAATILLIHHPRKPDKDSDFSLESDAHMWLTQACGSAAIIQNVDFRMGLQADNERKSHRKPGRFDEAARRLKPLRRERE